VIAVIAILLAIFIPTLRAARERGQRVVCLSNLHQLTLAWIAYADQHDSRLVCGRAWGEDIEGGRWRLHGWMGLAFFLPRSRSDLMDNPDKGTLWPYLRDVDVYRCPRGREGHAATYGIVSSANGTRIEGTFVPDSGGSEVTNVGVRVGSTVLRLTRLTDIVSPGPAARAVFLDVGQTPDGGQIYYYLKPEWYGTSPPPTRHATGTTISMADGHAEYWRWAGRETVRMPLKSVPTADRTFEFLADRTYEPKTQDGLHDLQRLQKATWGRLGYSTEGGP
jgi:prepilin-type processing-associated H-X9-DG protein